MCSLPMCRPENAADRRSSLRPVAELEQEIRELAGQIAAAMCRWLMLVGEFDAREGWAVDGMRSCAHWLSWTCSVAPGTAREYVRVASRLRELPLVRAAFAHGELSYTKVRGITRIATAETEAHLVGLGRHATGAQMENIVRGYRQVERATREQAQAAHERRFLTWSYDDDGSLRFTGRLAPDDGALLLAALEAESGSAPAPPESGPAPAREPSLTLRQRRADALMSLARAGLADNAGAQADGDPVQLVVHVDAATIAAEHIEERSEVEPGQVALAPETVRRLGCDAALVRIVERDGRPLSVSRRTRTVPPALRRALRSRDRGCRFPGCTHTKFLHAHHIHHWARGGPTKLDNLVQLCSYHHRLVHEAGFMVERAGAGVRFRRPNGREIPQTRPCRLANRPGIAAQNRARGIVIDETTCTPLSRGDTIDYAMAIEGLFAQRSPPA